MQKIDENMVVLWHPVAIEGWTALNRGMRQALVDRGIPRLVRHNLPGLRALGRFSSKFQLTRNLARVGKRRLVTISWASDAAVLPDAFWSEFTPWCYDCWGQDWPKWEHLLRRNRVRLAFFSARQPAEHFAKTIPGLQARWLPEAMDFSVLHPDKPLASRTLHVFEMGRRLNAVHDRIRDPLKTAGFSHLFDKVADRTAIPTLDELYRRMGDAAIVMCFPKVMTHPAGAGGVETVTQRYLETLGSGSLAVGHCPKELEDLMGYNPVIELSMTDPAGHLIDVLKNLASYQELADRSKVRVREIGGFELRSRQMLEFIAEFDAALSRPSAQRSQA